MPSPPKPWEVNSTVTSPTVASELSAPELPSRTVDVPARPTSKNDKKIKLKNKLENPY